MSSVIDSADLNVKKGKESIRCSEELCGCPKLFKDSSRAKNETINSEFGGWEIIELNLIQPRRGHLLETAADELGLYSYALEYTALWQGERSVGRGLRNADDLKQLRWALGQEIAGAIVPQLPESILTQGDAVAAALFACRLTAVPAFRVCKSLIAFCLDLHAFAIIHDRLICASFKPSFWNPADTISPWLSQVQAWHKRQKDELTAMQNEVTRLRAIRSQAIKVEYNLFSNAHPLTYDPTDIRRQDVHLKSSLADIDDMLGYLLSVTEAATVIDNLSRATQAAAQRASSIQSKKPILEESLFSLKFAFGASNDYQDIDLKASELNHRLELAQARFNDEVRQCQQDFIARRASLVTKLIKAQADYHASCAEQFNSVLDYHLDSSFGADRTEAYEDEAFFLNQQQSVTNEILSRTKRKITE